MKKQIIAAKENEDTRLEDMLDVLEDDFDYILSGLDKLNREGRESREEGISIAQQLHESLDAITVQIADIIGG